MPIASPYAPPPSVRQPVEPPREPGRFAELANTNAGRRITAFFRSGARGPVAVRSTVYGGLFLLFMTRGVGMSAPDTVNGLALGALYGIIGVALVLIYRTTRVINFAAGALGAVPAISALLMVTNHGMSYVVALPIAAVGGFLIGGLTDLWVMRRFSKSPRLIVTVVTIGVAQSFAAVGFFLPVWFGAKATGAPRVVTPWGDIAWRSSRGQPILTGDQIFAFAMVLALTVSLSVFLKRSRMGIALRASAENADRAALLGIPVRRVATLAWALAGLLSALAIFTQAPLIGVPNDATLGFDALLYGLAAAVVARMDRLGVALGAGAGIGLIIFASVSRTGSNNAASALMLVIILLALLAQRGSLSRAMDTGVATWQSVKPFRPIPTELRNVPEVVTARFVLYGVGLAVAVILPFVVDGTRLFKLELLPIFGIVGVSLVVLTGWAGQISLGQFGLVGMGAAAAGGLAANHNIDFFAALAIGVGAGALTAVIVGLPAVRIQGLYLAVTTLAFGYAVQNYILKPNYWIGRHLLPHGQAANIMRPVVYGRINLENERNFYFCGLVFFLLSVFAALAFRRNHSGRVLIGMRDNQRATSSYSVNPVRTKLAAFAVSGAFAGLAGVLFAYQQHNVVPDSYNVISSIQVFLAACIGGLTSVWAGALGVISFQAFVFFFPDIYGGLLKDHQTIRSVIPLLLTGPLLILNLYFNPGGLAEQAFATRDKFLRRIANKHGIHVPSLVADRLLEEEQQRSIVQHAEEAVEHVEEPAPYACPACDAQLTLEELQTHEHLRAREPEAAR
ncbi:MAG: branched-chain amino acid transport system permease protein livM [Actinomycetota bacterium]|jgi:branched-chain amino acid transport system permease protein|nr:branched-chain amino acid transport system permease protein livM [Actinomycetota bacterium]